MSVYWPRLIRAARVLDASRVPVFNEATGGYGLRRVVSLGEIPASPTSLEDNVRIIVDLPLGSGRGPQIPDSLRRWATTDADAWRLLLHLCYYWHYPGKSFRPQGRRVDGKGQLWGQSQNPDHYLPVDDDMLAAMTNPVSGITERKRRLFRARAALERLEEAREVAVIVDARGRLILPFRNSEKGAGK